MTAWALTRGATDTGRPGANYRRRAELGMLLLAAGIVVGAYVLMSLGTTNHVPPGLWTFLVIILGLGLSAHVATRVWAPDATPVLLPIVTMLNGLGYVLITQLGNLSEQLRTPGAALSLYGIGRIPELQAAWTAVGIGGYVATLVLVKRSRDLDRYRYLLLFAAVVLMLSPLVPGLGRNINGARLWVFLGPIHFQPVEIAKLLLCVFFASYFSEKRELLSIPTTRLGNRLVVDPRSLGPIVVAWVFFMGVLGTEHDVGFAVIVFLLFIALIWLATGRLIYVAAGIPLFLVGFLMASVVFTQVHGRVEDWLHPLANGQSQMAYSLFGIGTGGLLGTGLGYGATNLVHVAAAWSDYIFGTIGTEMGILGTTAIVFAFLLIVGAGLQIAHRARSEFASLLAAGLTFTIGIQAFVIMGGVVHLLPLTGVTLPFVAYGGSSLVANYILVGLLMRLSDEGSRSTAAAGATMTQLPPSGPPPAPLQNFDPTTIVS